MFLELSLELSKDNHMLDSTSLWKIMQIAHKLTPQINFVIEIHYAQKIWKKNPFQKDFSK